MLTLVPICVLLCVFFTLPMKIALPTENLSGVATVLIELEEDLAMPKRIIWVVHLLPLPFRSASPREEESGPVQLAHITVSKYVHV